MGVDWAALGFRAALAVVCAVKKEREGPAVAWPIGSRQSWPASSEKESDHRINRAGQSGISRCLKRDQQADCA